MSTYALDKLLELRRKAEDDAALELGRATAAAAAALAGQQALKRDAAVARVAWEKERATAGDQEAAVDVLARHRFVSRLAAAAAYRQRQADGHRVTVLEPASRSEASARQAYAAARQDRQAVDRHLERQRTADRLTVERRNEET
ncbi:MAG TPA: hypothetical protein VH374_19430 [Polyangia bacterium]|jgi:flagellar biosynthesis chaperone FliJ|nr:hypothetical protein [Polyangia bacterium]